MAFQTTSFSPTAFADTLRFQQLRSSCWENYEKVCLTIINIHIDHSYDVSLIWILIQTNCVFKCYYCNGTIRKSKLTDYLMRLSNYCFKGSRCDYGIVLMFVKSSYKDELYEHIQ